MDQVIDDGESDQSNVSPKSLPHTKSLSGLPDHIQLHSYKVTASDLIGSCDPVPDQAEPSDTSSTSNSNHSNQEDLKEQIKQAVDETKIRLDNKHTQGGNSPISSEEGGVAGTVEGSSDQHRETPSSEQHTEMTLEGTDNKQSSKVNDIPPPPFNETDKAAMKVLITMDTPQLLAEEIQSPTESKNILTTPSSSNKSDTLSRDVQSLLDTLRSPLPLVACEGGGAYLPPVHIPIVSRGSRYYRHSVKRRRAESRKEMGGDRTSEPLTETKELIEVGMAEDCVIVDEVCDVGVGRGVMGVAYVYDVGVWGWGGGDGCGMCV